MKLIAMLQKSLMLVTLLTSHLSRGRLKAVARENMSSIAMTWPTSQPPMGWLKLASWNMADMLTTVPTRGPNAWVTDDEMICY